jgi:hypothetical protein
MTHDSAILLFAQDQGFGLLMGKLQAALDADAFTNDAVVKYVQTPTVNCNVRLTCSMHRALCLFQELQRVQQQAQGQQGPQAGAARGESRLCMYGCAC